MADRPNILLITTDQQRFDTIHALGNPHIHTPHLDWLADNGLSFTHCYSDTPVCMPARITLMTGQHGFHHQVTGNISQPLPIDPRGSLPGLLTRAGYQTRAEGKMHFYPARAHYGFEHMEILEDYYREMARHPQWGIPTDHGLGQNEMQPGISTVDESHSLTHWTVERSINFIETRDPSRPFFLWTSFSKPHPPLDPCLSYWLMYQNSPLPEPVFGDWSQSLEKIPAGFREPTYILNNADRFSPQLIGEVRRAYYALITQIDYNLGLLFARLRELELLENTLILFTSDHGEMLGDHHLGAKSVFFEGSAHVPLILCPPGGFTGAERGSRCDRLACLADIYATCLRAGEAHPPQDYSLDGIDLQTLASGAVRRESLVGECDDRYMVLEERYKYTFCHTGGGELLFDLQNDPYEQHNLAGDPASAAVLEHLKACLVEHVNRWHPEWVEGGRLAVFPESATAEIRNLWPGFHSRQRPDEVLH